VTGVAILGVAVFVTALVSEVVFHTSVDPTESPVTVTPLGRNTAAGTVLGVAVALAVAGTGLASVVFATTAAHRRVERRGLRGRGLAAVTTLAAFVAFLGGWLVYDFYVVAREAARFVRRPASAT